LRPYTKATGDALKQAIRDGKTPLVTLDWSDSIASPDSRVVRRCMLTPSSQAQGEITLELSA